MASTTLVKDVNLTTCYVKNTLRIPNVTDVTLVPVAAMGSMVYDELTQKIYFSDGNTWLPTDGTATPTTLASVGAGSSIVSNGTGPNLAVKSIGSLGSGISVISSPTELFISNTLPSSDIQILDDGTGTHESLISSNANPVFGLKGLKAGGNITLSSTATDITIDAVIPPVPVVTLMSAGGIFSLAGLGVYPNLTVKGLNAGPGITMTNVGTTSVTISAPNAAGVTTLTSTGGFPLVVDGTGPALSIKGLIGATGMIDIIPNTTDLTLSLTGGPISLSDIGADPLHVSIAGPSVGNALRTKGLVPGNGISLTSTVTDVIIETIGADTITLEAGPGIAIGGTPSNPVIINLNPDVTTLSNLSPGAISLVPPLGGVGPNLQVKGLIAGAGISLTDGGSDIVVANTSVVGTLTLGNGGVAPGNVSLVAQGFPPDFKTKGLVAGTGITLTSTLTDITIDSTSVGSLSSAGGTYSLVNNGPLFVMKGLSAGPNVTITDNTTFLTIDSVAPPSGVSQIVAGAGILISPPSGIGVVTIDSTGVGGPGVAQIVAGTGITISPGSGVGTVTINATAVSPATFGCFGYLTADTGSLAPLTLITLNYGTSATSFPGWRSPLNFTGGGSPNTTNTLTVPVGGTGYYSINFHIGFDAVNVAGFVSVNGTQVLSGTTNNANNEAGASGSGVLYLSAGNTISLSFDGQSSVIRSAAETTLSSSNYATYLSLFRVGT